LKQRWVDAFNVIHRLPELTPLLAENNEACRQAFLAMLAPLVYASGERWTVVFDAPRPGRASAPGPIDVVYARSADAWIVDGLERAMHADAITVVSSDEKDIGRRARALGATVMSAATLARILRGEAEPELLEAEKPDQVSEAEVDYWLDAFGGGGSGEPKQRFDTIDDPPDEEREL
jgi:predicted RNA-binding protein with PIN domain